MDFDFRASAICAAHHLSAVQAACLHSDNYMAFYESDGDDDTRSYFPCPFCCVEIEVPILCSHLQEEHCFDLKNAVCPLCAANLGKDEIRHFILQHSSSLKRRWKTEKSSIWSGNSAMLQKKLAANTRGNKHESMPDPLLSPFACNVAVPTPNSIHQDKRGNNNASSISDSKSGREARGVGDKKDHEEKRQRAAFLQELVAATIF
ncbi:protein DEHYDRATION-INDUCED 19 homolog 6-like isoform X2 [Prosopis cineraria]|uniref:protein DEHYDRATION-INDUCED 19 homolog 6-like isoform X2 n=1 Tax=Prosopis cineraria TaxID=364024 RepID=UPI002410A9E1|nr:protein DEHYDRATION-INDUCED 19 homolog 6-like isoform X2 [Prosopis cineraria]